MTLDRQAARERCNYFAADSIGESALAEWVPRPMLPGTINDKLYTLVEQDLPAALDLLDECEAVLNEALHINPDTGGMTESEWTEQAKALLDKLREAEHD